MEGLLTNSTKIGTAFDPIRETLLTWRELINQGDLLSWSVSESLRRAAVRVVPQADAGELGYVRRMAAKRLAHAMHGGMGEYGCNAPIECIEGWFNRAVRSTPEIDKVFNAALNT